MQDLMLIEQATAGSLSALRPPPGAWRRACYGTRWWTERQASSRKVTVRPVPKRHWRSYGTEPLPTGQEALHEPFRAFPSWLCASPATAAARTGC
jgi:hypothetical protein